MKNLRYFFLALPFYSIFFAFFVIPLCLTLIVSFWDYNEYSIIPDFIFENYIYIFEGCLNLQNEACLTFKTYFSTIFFLLFIMVHYFIYRFFSRLFFGILYKVNWVADSSVFSLYNTFLDFKCNKNGFLDTSTWPKWTF